MILKSVPRPLGIHKSLQFLKLKKNTCLWDWWWHMSWDSQTELMGSGKFLGLPDAVGSGLVEGA